MLTSCIILCVVTVISSSLETLILVTIYNIEDEDFGNY